VDEEEERVLEVIMLSLRTKDGLNMRTLTSEYRTAVINALLPYYRYSSIDGCSQLDDGKELVQLFDANNDKVLTEQWSSGLHDAVSRVRLVDPDGFLLSNEIISSVFAAIIS